MQLRELIEKYLSLAGDFGLPVRLSSFGLDRAETERLFSAFDEDYNISRYLQFSCGEGASYSINGFPQTHVAIDAAIRELL
jgi:hypothetical protein